MSGSAIINAVDESKGCIEKAVCITDLLLNPSSGSQNSHTLPSTCRAHDFLLLVGFAPLHKPTKVNVNPPKTCAVTLRQPTVALDII